MRAAWHAAARAPGLALALALLAVTAWTGCSSAAPQSSAAGAKPACCVPVVEPATAVAGRFTDESLYQSDSTWTSDEGRPFPLNRLAGRPQVVAMFFTSCQFTCPLIVNDLRRIEASLSPATRGRVGFTLISFDSRRDTPAALAEYRKLRDLPRGRWNLLRGEAEDVLELAALLGVTYKQDAAGNFAHSNQITILNAQGEIVRRLVGLNLDAAPTAELLERLAGNGSR